MTITTARSIDVHAHAVLEGTMGAAGKYGPEIGSDDEGKPWVRIGDHRLVGVNYRGSPFMDVDLRLAQMQDSGIEYQVLSPNPLTYFHFIEARDAIPFCHRHNDELADLVSPHSEHLAALAALPMQDPVAAGDELERAVRELGMLGAYIGAELPESLDSPRLDVFYEKLCELDVPLFIHPAPAGIDGPEGDQRLKRFDLEMVLGFAAQETLTFATLIFGGVMSRHPSLDVCISDGGGAIAVLAERLADAARRRPWSPAYLREDGAFEAVLSRFWIDNHIHDKNAISSLEKLFGAEHIVLGTNFAGWDEPTQVRPEEVSTQHMADNARCLLRIKTAGTERHTNE